MFVSGLDPHILLLEDLSVMRSFEKTLSICVEHIEFELRGFTAVEWSSFVLNPRRLRGSDFLMRWSQGVLKNV